jgi:hypothetical protein
LKLDCTTGVKQCDDQKAPSGSGRHEFLSMSR